MITLSEVVEHIVDLKIQVARLEDAVKVERQARATLEAERDRLRADLAEARGECEVDATI